MFELCNSNKKNCVHDVTVAYILQVKKCDWSSDWQTDWQTDMKKLSYPWLDEWKQSHRTSSLRLPSALLVAWASVITAWRFVYTHFFIRNRFRVEGLKVSYIFVFSRAKIFYQFLNFGQIQWFLRQIWRK